ncbi:MAG: CheY-like receiver protein [Idiomarinaceae bacterium HL-53]|nr:MAG: CheY-like receiver protein [Idiomarinaceae bacterium HL-53]CUS48790.1 CheY chemotaxis protein or a CheY-like REC (receiver) domain [Idiomarinaceae bacterium HL-53]
MQGRWENKRLMKGKFLFADEAEQDQDLPEESWKILIVDDEPEVHAVTKLALSDFHFLGRGLEFLSAHSGAEAKELVKAHPDAAIILLDVVMETDDAGLMVAKYIREELGNRYTRIILRTGQPGQAPERTVIVNYDINDYKSKTELTAQKLFTAVMSSLRSYRDIISIVHSRNGLEKIIASTGDLFALQSMDHFISGLVQQLGWLIGGARQTLYAAADERVSAGEMKIRAAYGEDADQLQNQPIKAALPKAALVELDGVIRTHGIYYGDDFVLAYCPSQCRPQGALLCLVGLSRALSEKEKELLQLFADNVQVALDNVICLQDTDQLLSELVARLMDLEQAHYAEHPKQQSAFVQLVSAVARELGWAGERVQIAGTAATLYERAEKLFTLVEEQPASKVSPCQQRLVRAIRPLQMADNRVSQVAVLALEERLERYDGMGLPAGKVGADIADESALFGLSRTFYELVHQDLALEDVLARIDAEKGKVYSPELCGVFTKHGHAFYELVMRLDSL